MPVRAAGGSLPARGLCRVLARTAGGRRCRLRDAHLAPARADLPAVHHAHVHDPLDAGHRRHGVGLAVGRDRVRPRRRPLRIQRLRQPRPDPGHERRASRVARAPTDVERRRGGLDADRRIPRRGAVSRRHRANRRRIEPRLAGPDAGLEGRPERAVRRPRRHGLRAARLLRQPDRHAELRRTRSGRAPLQQHAHDGALLAEPLVHHHRPQPPHQRHGLHHRACLGLPRLQRGDAVRERDALGDAAGARLRHLHGRQVAPDPEQPGDRGRPVRPLAARTRLPALLRVPRRRHEPVVSRPRLRQPPGRAAARRQRRAITSRRTWSTSRSSSSPTSARSIRTSRSTCTSASGRRTPRITFRRSGPTSTPASSTTAGTPTARRSSPARRSSGSCRRTQSCRATTPTCPRGSRSRPRRAGCRPG